MDHQTLSIVIPILVILPLLYFRLSRMMKPQRLKLNRVWIRPAIMLFAAAAVLAASPPPTAMWPWFLIAAAAGSAGGWYWGKLIRIDVHPEDGTLMASGSQAGVIVLVLLLVLRIGMRAGVQFEAQALHVNVAVLTDVFIVLAAALFAARGLEMWLRGRAVMARGTPPV